MFVANHNSWMDIPFMGATIGWRNYKFVAKKELEKVPILSAAIVTADNLMVDRKDKRSGLRTLRTGMEFMKNGIHLCTFPEGTRSRDGHLKDFLGGAFKMAHKVGAPVIPLSIVGAQKVQPIHWMFPLRPSRRHIKVVVHPPVESKGLTEAELSDKVRQAMVDGLPDDQKPLED
jgi:1-acyl-sn-glycerol-3-phosphate acyltransferase